MSNKEDIADMMDLLWDAKEALKDLEDYSYRVLDDRISAIEKILLLKDDLVTLDEVVAESRPAPKPIDWSKVAACVPVKAWDDGDAVFFYPQASEHWLTERRHWTHRSLITGIDIAWSGGECPLPEGLVINVALRSGEFIGGSSSGAGGIGWHYDCSSRDIISFRVVGIEDGWSEETEVK